MATASRERATIDLRGLGPALKAHAQARNLTVSDVARLAVAAVLETPGSEAPVQVSGETDAAGDRTVKLTIRLRRGVAARLATRARACGLSHGAYLTTLIDGAPAPPLATATALGTSTEQLAVVSADLNELIRTIRRDSSGRIGVGQRHYTDHSGDGCRDAAASEAVAAIPRPLTDEDLTRVGEACTSTSLSTTL